MACFHVAGLLCKADRVKKKKKELACAASQDEFADSDIGTERADWPQERLLVSQCPYSQLQAQSHDLLTLRL
jgi:hypothetical protein